MSEWDWRFLSKRVDAARTSGTSFEGHCILVIQHGLPDLVHLVESFVETGCDPEGLTVIGIPYSSRNAVGNTISDRFPRCKVHLPRVMPFEGYVSHALTEALDTCRQRGHRLIIVEDGGYAVPILGQFLELRLASHDNLLGAVEQTTRGAGIDRALEKERTLPLPVISIPDCALKSGDHIAVEPRPIAEAVNRSLRKLINRITEGRADTLIKTVGVYGLGAIGTNVAQFFNRDAETQVYVRDFNPVRMQRARYSGMKELNFSTVNECDLLIGVTGGTSLGPSVLPYLKNGAIIASASSRQIEIDVSWLEANAQELGSDDFEVEVVQPLKAYRKYAMKSGAGSIYLLYDGYPINFYGQSLPDHVADVVLSLLLEGALTLVRRRGNLENIVYNGASILEDAEKEIAADIMLGWDSY